MSDDSGYPYEIHTGREFALMLQGEKPLAHFYDQYPGEPCEEIIPEREFEPYVDRGIFEKFEYVELLTEPLRSGYENVKGFRHVFYATPAEAWRVGDYIDMQFRGWALGWSVELERLQGHLLGYEEWQTDIHLQRLRAVSKVRWLIG